MDCFWHGPAVVVDIDRTFLGLPPRLWLEVIDIIADGQHELVSDKLLGNVVEYKLVRHFLGYETGLFMRVRLLQDLP